MSIQLVTVGHFTTGLLVGTKASLSTMTNGTDACGQALSTVSNLGVDLLRKLTICQLTALRMAAEPATISRQLRRMLRLRLWPISETMLRAFGVHLACLASNFSL